MGCDIHAILERAERGTYHAGDPWCHWRNAGDYDPGRNYELFAALADVRNSYGIPPVAEAKGMPGWEGVNERHGWHVWRAPDEPCEIFQAYYERWYGDAHSATWLTLAEIRAYDATQEIDDRDVIIGRNRFGVIKAGSSSMGGEVVGRRRIFVWPGADESEPTCWDRLIAELERAKRDGDTDGDVRLVCFFDN